MQGQLRLESFAEGPETLAALTGVTVEGERPDAPDQRFALREVTTGRRGELRVTLDGVDGRGAAEALRGRLVFAARSELPDLPAGEHYGHEIEGCCLEDQDGAAIGRVVDVWETGRGGSDLLVVEAEGGRRTLVPAAFLREVDVAAGRAVVEVIPGLLDPEEAV